jgi:hypothetical protein
MDYDNEQVLSISIDDLPEEAKALVEKVVQQYRDKCLLSFTKMRDKVIQKTMLPKTLFHGQRDPNVVAKQMLWLRQLARPWQLLLPITMRYS